MQFSGAPVYYSLPVAMTPGKNDGKQQREREKWILKERKKT